MRIGHFITVWLIVLNCEIVFSQKVKSALPDFAIIQYAGSIGHISGGIGYDVFKSRGRFSTHFGWVPLGAGGTRNVISARLMFEPITLTVWNRVYMNPIDVGVMASFNYGDDLQSRRTELRSDDYSWWHPAIRTHVVLENAVTYQFKKEKRFHSVTGYIEVNTNEYYFITFIRNLNSVRLTDIIKLGTGVRLAF